MKHKYKKQKAHLMAEISKLLDRYIEEYDIMELYAKIVETKRSTIMFEGVIYFDGTMRNEMKIDGEANRDR